MTYRLSLLAEADLENVYREGIAQFGPNQASDYLIGLEGALETLVKFPRVNRERSTREGPVRVQRFNAHVVFYQILESEIFILRIRHGREDWQD